MDVPEDIKEELTVVLKQYLNNPPFMNNPVQLEKLTKVLEGDPVGIMAARLIADAVSDWIKLTGKVIMAYAMLGITAQDNKDQTKFIKKLTEEI